MYLFPDVSCLPLCLLLTGDVRRRVPIIVYAYTLTLKSQSQPLIPA